MTFSTGFPGPTSNIRDTFLLYPWLGTLGPATNVVGLIIDAAGELVACTFAAPKTGIIDKVFVRVRLVVAAQSLDVRLETVSATTGSPSGTLLATGSSGTIGTPASSTSYWVALTTPVAVKKGDPMALTVGWTSTVGFVQLAGYLDGLLSLQGFPTPWDYGITSAGAWTQRIGGTAIVGLQYSDGSRPQVPGAIAVENYTASAWASNTTPDELGAYFSLPFDARVTGLLTKSTQQTDFTAVLYDTDGRTTLTSVAVDAQSFGVNAAVAVQFPKSVLLKKDTFYRATILPTTTTTFNADDFQLDAAATLESWPGGVNWYKTERTDAGAWTETKTLVPSYIQLMIDGIGTAHSPRRGGFA